MKIELIRFVHPTDRKSDLTPALRRVSGSLKSGDTLVFPGGQHFVLPEGAASELLRLTNHDHQVRLTALHPQGLHNVTIEGNGSTLLVAGAVAPLWFTGCRGLIVKNLTLDRVESFSAVGEIRSVTEDRFELELPSEHNPAWTVQGGQMQLSGPQWRQPVRCLFEWDRSTRAPVPTSADNLGDWDNHWTFEKAGADRIAIVGRSAYRPREGNWLQLRTFARFAPALVLDRCSDVVVENVTIHAAVGMATIAQRCRNVRMSNCRCSPSPRGLGIFTDADDATHFASCSGIVELERCEFERQLDDASNVHGIYFPIVRRPSTQSLIVEKGHFQQGGALVGEAGDSFQLFDKRTQRAVWQSRAHVVNDLNDHYCELEFENPVPPNVTPGDALDNLDWHPEANFRECRFEANRARGLLLSSRGKTLVENCFFALNGAAIWVPGGLEAWYESGPVAQLTLRNNRFKGCGIEPAWGSAVIQLSPELTDVGLATESFHQHILVERNAFSGPQSRLIDARFVERLDGAGNTIDTVFPQGSDPVKAHRCGHVAVKFAAGGAQGHQV